WDVSSTEVVRSVLPGGSLHEDFLVWLDRAADFMESLGEVPVIFRPWHENIGSWFWWGGRLCSEEEYKALYRLTWSRLTVDRGLRNIIWCYSPNGPVTPEEYMSRYPGDDVVDILGTDYYERIGDETLDEASKRFSGQMKEMLGTLTGLSTEHGKLMCLSETGLEGQVDPRWWSDALYPALHGSPVCYVLTWRNAHDKPGHFYAPWKGSGNEEDFKQFTEKNDIVLL
ncbi:MAG: beta-mannosidase, partial [Bacteroidales bacterium]|nr:beta-mannosidase [Bacteroidales bacterium]